MSCQINAQWVYVPRLYDTAWQDCFASKSGCVVIMAAAPCCDHSAKVFIYPDQDANDFETDEEFWGWLEGCLVVSWKSWQDIHDRWHREKEEPRPMPTMEQIKAAFYAGGGRI
jgi:hypothetical protein